ncbi:HEL272Wp [Eremothecium sinecaudum]|uniref:acid phosphatase n=1 Tax=Eremothecium sinecaudum TaxID=45286 RepID=A0A0X8HT82_9SACH|nr:HEL272Wp [Eremothecium sinecaudum]AMD21009.1 HEL272Wp [Eremothecium sinecaudum]
MKEVLLKSVLIFAICLVGTIKGSPSGKFRRRRFDRYSPSLDEIQADAATAKTHTWTSSVEGRVFKRFYIIWLENADYDKAAEEESILSLRKHGISLTNYWGLTHPSQPNYIAAAGGDYFGANSDSFLRLPANVSTVVDLLATKNISWAEYQESMPYSGFQGYNFSNQETYANDYVRKHNPLVTYDSVTSRPELLGHMKNFTAFYRDLEQQTLPQFAYITPNMTNCGHDTTIQFAGSWTKEFLEPLLENEYFMKDTLVLLTFDENDTYATPNRVFSLLLGGAIPEKLRGTVDDTYYDHYSQLSTVEANWDLPSLGRNDVYANVFEFAAEKCLIDNSVVDTTNMYSNVSYVGYFSNREEKLPIPDIESINMNGKGVLKSIKDTWAEAYWQEAVHFYSGEVNT